MGKFRDTLSKSLLGKTGGKSKSRTREVEGSSDDIDKESDPSVNDGVGEDICYDGCRTEKTGVDIVFVHGLRGSRYKTWSKGKFFWPKELLRDDVRESRIIMWGYDANIAKALGFASKESVFGHAETLLGDLARIRSSIDRPIIFICHSLGGLIVKQALIRASALYHNQQFLEKAAIYAATIGVIFFGTPHRGSDTENLGEYLAKGASLFFRQPNKQLLRILEANSHILEGQRSAFTTVSNTLTIVCVSEEKPTLLGQIVTKSSACYDGFNVREGSINANHMDMVRFENKVDQGYKRTLGFINTILHTPLPQLQKQRQETENDKARIAEILHLLDFDRIRTRVESIPEAYANTCSWTLEGHPATETEPYQDSLCQLWLRNNDTFLWISGKAGSGKSTLMKYLHKHVTKEDLSTWRGDKDVILAGHFFSDLHNDELQMSREGMVRSILCQIFAERPNLLKKAFHNYYGTESMLPKDFLSWHSLRAAFTLMLDCIGNDKICLFVDGLDEYRMTDRQNEYTEEQLDLLYDGDEGDAAWGLSTWIREGYTEIAEFLRSLKNRANLKICLSSRELNEFETAFRTVSRIQMHKYNEKHIMAYCEGRLLEIVRDEKERSHYVSVITAKAHGVFLWVSIIISLLIRGYIDSNSEEELLTTIASLPSQLGGEHGLYFKMIQITRREYRSEAKRLFQLMTQWPLHRNGPDIATLYLAEQAYHEVQHPALRSWSERRGSRLGKPSHPQDEALPGRLNSRCGGLLELNVLNEVQYMHLTAKQFMDRKRLFEKLFAGAAGFASSSDIGLAQLSGLVQRWRPWEQPPPRVLEKLRRRDSKETSFTGSRTLFRSGLAQGRSKFYQDISIFKAIQQDTMELARRLETICEDQMNDHYNDIIDELHDFGLAKNEQSDSFPSTRAADQLWPILIYEMPPDRFFYGPFPPLKVQNFLELAATQGLNKYLTAKVDLGGIPDQLLHRLLYFSSRFWYTSVLSLEDIRRFTCSPRICESILRQGARPNEMDPSNVESQMTIWTSLLEELFHIPGLESLPESGSTAWTVKFWVARVKAFLEYGADPKVHWQPQIEYRKSDPMTPEKALDLARKMNLIPKEDFEDIKAILQMKSGML